MELLSKRFIIPALLITLGYILLVTYSMNLSILKEALLGNYTFDYKAGLLIALLNGMWTAMSGWGLFMLFITAVLTGANISMLAIKIRSFGGIKNTHIIAGGGSFLGIIGSGCAACGLPIISLLGLTGSIMYLPFRGTELSVIAIFLLSLSFYAMIRATTDSKRVCEINSLKLSKVVAHQKNYL
jgi:hypothetical protein